MATIPEAPPENEIAHVIARALDAADEPLPPNQLRERLHGPNRRSVDELQSILDREVEAGRLYRYAAYRSKAPRYWTRGEKDLIQVAIIRRLHDRSSTEAELLKGIENYLKGISKASQKRVLGELVAEKRVQKWPPFLGGRTARYGVRAPDPREYAEQAIEKLSKLLEPFDISRDKILAVLADLDSDHPAPTVALVSATADVESLILERVYIAQPRAAERALVLFGPLRQAVPEVDADEFDRAILALRNQGRVVLHASDYPLGLTERERSDAVKDSAGTHYVGLVLEPQA